LRCFGTTRSSNTYQANRKILREPTLMSHHLASGTSDKSLIISILLWPLSLASHLL
jgi:hypothetical protein